MTARWRRVASGSPPRAWGQFCAPHQMRGAFRFTPTGVGTIETVSASATLTTVHPHGRGDNAALPHLHQRDGGSPPRAWGQFNGGVELVECERFTPTGVGTITCIGAEPDEYAVHPHGRGDNRLLSVICTAICGSPPRAWGQWRRPNRRVGFVRFTPTGVGTIIRRHRQPPENPVHPHGRGDNVLSAVSQHSLFGSPPRAWGQCLSYSVANMTGRFTPTGVGTMTRRRSDTTANAVHPHGRGDNARRPGGECVDAGSPPRAWGQCAGCR